MDSSSPSANGHPSTDGSSPYICQPSIEFRHRSDGQSVLTNNASATTQAAALIFILHEIFPDKILYPSPIADNDFVVLGLVAKPGWVRTVQHNVFGWVLLGWLQCWPLRNVLRSSKLLRSPKNDDGMRGNSQNLQETFLGTTIKHCFDTCPPPR